MQKEHIERINQLSRQNSDELNKYTHFLLAIAGAAIVYTTEKLAGNSFNLQTTFIILSVIFWAISFALGIWHLNIHRNHLVLNAECLLHDLSGDQMLNKLNPLAEKARNISNFQLVFIFLGGLSYFIAMTITMFYPIKQVLP